MPTATAASEIALPPHPRDELKSLALEADQFYASDDWKSADAPTRQKYLDRSAEIFDEAFKSAESSLDEAEADSFYNSTTAFLQGKMAEHNNRDADEKRRRAAADKSMQVFTERQKVTPDQVRGVVNQSLEVAGGMSAQTRGSGVMKLDGEQGKPSIGVQPLDWTPSAEEFWKDHYDLHSDINTDPARRKYLKKWVKEHGYPASEADNMLLRQKINSEESAKLAARDLAFSKGEDAAGVAAAERESTLAYRRNAKLAALESTQSSAGNPNGRKLPFRVVRTNGMLNIEPKEGKAEETMLAAERMGLLTSEEAARLIPSGVEMDKEFASRPKAQGGIVTAVKEFGSSILPALGTAAGTAIGAAASKGDVSTAMVGGASGGAAALWMQKKVFGEADQAQREANARAHPGWAQVGSFVPFLVSMFQKTPPALTTAGRMAQTAKVALTPGTAAARWESALQSGIAMGRAGFSSGVQQRYVEGNKDVNPIDEGVRSFIAGGAMGILKPAKSILMAMTGKAVKDAAAVTFAEGLYDLAVHNKPIDFKAIADEAPGTFTAFALQNAVMGLFHKFAAAPEARRARAFENYRMARERQDAKLRSGEWGFDAYNEAVAKLDEVFTAKIKSEKDKEAFLEHAAIYAARHNAAQAATQAAEVHAKAANDAEQQAQRFSDQGYPESAAEASKLAQTRRAAMEKAYVDAYTAHYLAAQAVADAKIAVEQAVPEPHPIIAQIDGVVAAHASELAALGHPADFVLVTIPDESGGGGFQFNQKTGKIEYDPVRIEKVTIGMTPRQLAKYIRRGIAEEIIHVATDKYASESPENEAKLRAILGDAEAVAAAEKAYGKNAFEKLNETQKAFEVARVLIQGPRALTEAAYRFFKDLLRWLAQKVKNLSPETKELLDGIKAKMEAHKSGKVEEATPKAQPSAEQWKSAWAAQREIYTDADGRKRARNTVVAPKVSEYQPGDRVVGFVDGKAGAVTGTHRDGVTVTFDDGSKSSFNNMGGIVPEDALRAHVKDAAGDANYKPEPAKESEPKNEKAQSVPSVQKADESVRLPQAEVTPAAPSPSEPTAVLPVGSFVKADRYKSEGTPLKIIGTEPSRDGRPVYQALVNGRVLTLDSKEISEVVSTPEQAAAPSPEPPTAPSPEPVTPAAAKPVEAERNLAPFTEAERSLAESLEKKYGMPVLPTVQAEGEIENLSRFSNMLERAADKSNDETELAQILSAAKGRIDESRIANAVANNPHSSEATFSEAKANSERQKMAGDESIAYLDARRAELRKQRGLDAQPAAAPAAEQPVPQKSFRQLMDEQDAKDRAMLEKAEKEGRIGEIAGYTPAVQLPDGRVVESKSNKEGHGELAALFPDQKVIRGFVNNDTKKFMSAMEVARERMKPAPAPVAEPTKGGMTQPEMDEAIAVLLKAPVKAGGKPRVSLKTQAEEAWFRRGFESANGKPGQPPPEQPAGVPAKEQKLHDAFASGWSHAQIKLREKPTPSSPAPAAAPATVTPQSQGGIFGYAWADIRSKQQGGKLAQAIRGAAVKTKATEADLKLLESKGAEWLYDNDKRSIIDRLGLPAENPSKKAEAKAPVSEKAKQTKGVTLKVQNPYSLAPENEKILTMKGDIIKLAAQPEHEFFIYKAPNSNYWRVVERKTGSGIGAEMQKTRAAAIESAEQSVAKVAPDEFTKILNDAEWRNTEKPSKKAEVKPKPPAQSFTEKVRAKIVPGAKVSVQLVRGAKLAHPAVVGDVFLDSNGKPESVSVTFDGGGNIKKGRTQTVPFGNVSLRPGVESRMLTNEQFEGMTKEEAQKTRAAAKEFKKLVIEYPELGFYSGHLEAVAAGPQGEAAIKKARADAYVEAMTALGVHPDKADARDAVTQASLVERLRELTKKPGMERKQYADFQEAKEEGDGEIKAGDLKYGETINIGGEEMRVTDIDKDGVVTLQDGEKFGTQEVHPDESLMIKGETPEPVAPKLRPSDGKGTGELLQGDAAPFNLVAETAADIAKREDREAAEQIAKDANDAAEAKAKQDKEQGNLFGVATPRMGQELADKADALGIPLKTEQIKKLIADDPDTLREVRARIDRETGGDQAGMVRTANPLENRDERSAPFYSALTKTVQALPQETMTVQQARAAIEKGAKKDEIAMSGIFTDALSPLAGRQPGDKVTKAELTGYALERQSVVQDVVLGQPLGDKVKKSAQDAVPFSRQGFDGWIIPDANGDMTFAGSTKQDAADRWNDAWRPTDTPTPTHFSQYQLPGADEGSYREMFVTWPGLDAVPFDPAKVTIKRERSSVTQGTAQIYYNGEPVGLRYADEGSAATDWKKPDSYWIDFARKQYELGYPAEETKRNGWRDGHSQYSDIANPIVRIRRNIRTDAEGRKTYFIEEIQGPGKGEQEKMPPELRKRIYEIGMKRALRDAVDEGADAIAWTLGQEQADRYSLEKQVDRIIWSDGFYADSPATKVVTVDIKGQDRHLALTLAADGKVEKVGLSGMGKEFIGKPVEDVVGKEIAAKILTEKDGNLSGEGLKVGGEGLKRVYDQMLPAIANDLAKKFGVKAGRAELPSSEDGHYLVEHPDFHTRREHSRAKATAFVEANPGWTMRPDPEHRKETPATTIHSLPIPDALKTQQRGGNTIFTANPADSLRETSTKNAAVDEERAKLGLDPIMSEIRQSHPVVWDAAMRALERDPMAGQSLVNEINGRPRALTATEEAIILRHKINTQTAFYREMEVANDGNASPQDRMSAKLYAAQHLDAMNEIDNATRKSGTEWGRLGAFRQRLAREDYTLVSMLRKRSMAIGERIEPGGVEYQFVEKLNKRIAELEAKATQDARNHAAELEQLRETAMEDAIQKMRSDGTPAQKKEREILARIAANMESAKENADAALREMGFGPVANAAGPSGDIIGTANPQDANTLDPKVLKLLSVGGANHLRKLGNDRAKWDEAMLSNYGPKVQPHLDAVWDVSQATLNDFIDGQAPKEIRENTKKKILTDAEKQKRILDSIRRKSATPDKAAPYLKQLAKQLVSQGVSDRWTLLTTMETMLKDILPDATRSEIRDSLADYGEGKYRELSTDEASVKMRRLRAQLQQEAKIEDMMRRGELPWLIGSERGEPDAETRTMIKEVNEIKKELELEATNENQGKSARAAIKTRLRNEIEELEKFIKTRERIPSNRRSVEDDPETAQLRRDVRELRAKYQEIVGVDTMAEEAAKKSALEKSIADLQNQIVTGEIEQAAKQQTVDTPEIAALKAQKAALLEQRKAMRSPSTEDIERKKEQALLDRITKLSARIATGVADTKVGKPTVESANVSAYRDIIKDLNKQLAEIRNPKKSPEQTKLDELDKRIAEVSAKIARGDLSAKQGKPTVDTAEQAVRKDTLRALNKQLADMRKAAKPTLTPDEIALKTWKTRAEKRLIDLKDRTARGDFSKKVRKVMPMDTEALKTKAALEAAKLEFDQANHKAMTANAPWWVKAMDVVQKYRRWAVLTSVTVFEKLAMAAAWRTFVFQPIEDAAGSIIRHIPFIKQVAVLAPRHGQGFNTRIQLDGLINGFASGASEAATHLKKAGNLLTGSKALSWLFGEMDEAKRLTQTPIEALSGKRKVEPDTAWEIPGVLHAVVKDIPKMVEFHKSVAFRTKWYADRGVDVSDPLMQEKIQIESFQDAMRAIFMQDNAVLNKLNRFIRSLGEPDAKTGKVNKWGKVWQTAFKVEFPIVKIPTNIVAEAFEYVSGFPAGLLNVRRAIKDGITNLHPEHADMIMRQLKKGLVGPAILLTGFLLASNIGGYFQHGRKRDPDEVPAGGIRIGDTTVHERALHAPALLILQAGATIARVMHSRLHKSDEDEQGLGAGLVASAMGLADEIPFVKEAFNLSALRNPHQKSHWFGAKARSIVEPTLMQWIAKLRDTDESGNPIKRQADGFVDEMKMGIPGLRETLDVKQEKVPHARSHRR